MIGIIVAILLADVVPDGQKYIPVTTTLSDTAKLGEHALYLVTFNDRMRSHVRVQPDIGDGPLSVPDGYRDHSYLVALTPEQVKELDEARDGKWEDRPSDESAAPSKLHTFFAREDLPRTSVGTRLLVPQDDERSSITRELRLHGVERGALQLVASKTASDDASASPALQIGLVSLALGLALGTLWLIRRRRGSVSRL